jgi:hypothetical protein
VITSAGDIQTKENDRRENEIEGVDREPDDGEKPFSFSLYRTRKCQSKPDKMTQTRNRDEKEQQQQDRLKQALKTARYLTVTRLVPPLVELVEHIRAKEKHDQQSEISPDRKSHHHRRDP